MIFPVDFLNTMATERCLSRLEIVVLFLRFEEGLDYGSISRRLDITKDATLKRMGQIYKKFGIDGQFRGKDTQLIQYLNQRYEDFADRGLHSQARENLSTKAERELRIVLRELAELKSDFRRLKEESPQLESIQETSAPTQERQDTTDLIEDLLVKLMEKGCSSQVILKELASEIPKLIERKAAESDKYSEREITHSLLRCAKKFFLGLERGLPERYITQSNKPDEDVDTVSL